MIFQLIVSFLTTIFKEHTSTTFLEIKINYVEDYITTDSIVCYSQVGIRNCIQSV